jgi:Excalibur calcium-binding domain
MKNIIFIVIAVFGLYKYQESKKNEHQHLLNAAESSAETPSSSAPTQNNQFKCDGRTHCSNMTSCEESTFFLRNCPNTEMDGDNDGIPCESQWCN